MDMVFSNQIGRNMEVYVDDMIVKTSQEGEHQADLAEAFAQMRKHNMRLNPEKCSLGIQGGKFLGFMITSRGIEAIPDKCQAILDMKSPANVKDVQKLTGKMAGLSRFLPNSGQKAAPFFACLRKDAQYEWTPECDRLLVDIKRSLKELE